MSIPKSVVKFKKGDIVYTSNVDRVQYTMRELTRAALRDVGKFLRKYFQEEYYRIFKRHSGEGPKAISWVVVASKSTKYPRVEIGIKHSNPSTKVRGFYTYFHEKGTKKERPYQILLKAARANIPTIVEIESKYLSALESEAEALRLIESEDEYTGGGGDD